MFTRLSLFQKNCKLVAIDLSKRKSLAADPKAMLQINFTGNMDRTVNTTVLVILDEVKNNILDFSPKSVRALWIVS